MLIHRLWKHRSLCGTHSTLRRLVAVTTLGAIAAAPVAAGNRFDRGNPHGNQLILQAQSEDGEDIAQQYGLEIAGELASPDGYLALLQPPESLTAAQVEELLRDDPRVKGLSRVALASLPASSNIEPAQDDVVVDTAKVGDFTTPCIAQGFSELLWSGYADQEAVREIRLHAGHLENGDCGSAIVAVLDSGVDPDHPLLRGALLPGYDFILDTAGFASEWDGLNASVTAILEASVTAILEESETTVLQGGGEVLTLGALGLILDASVTAILERESVPPFFGHGTMNAGLVRLAAPSAKILPLRVFDSFGSAHVFDVVRAIHYAVDNGADVISMSFSMDTHSVELMRAIRYARSRGVVCVAAAGNDGEHTLVYPAAHPDVIAVAALDGEELSPFSNFGAQLIDVAAPGTGVISTYPGGLYGAGWGTSFSTPLVAGTMALLVHLYPDKDISTLQHMENDLRQGSEALESLGGSVGGGRLDVLATVLEALDQP